MNTLRASLFLPFLLLLAGCMGSSNSPSAPPPAPVASAPSAESAGIRPGDKIVIRLSGVPDDGYTKEVQVPATGIITVPLLTQTFQVTGRNAGDLSTEITSAYKTEKIYTNPDVTVIPEERYVNVGGDVRSPARVTYTPDLTLLSAVNSCGGFTEYADRRHVRILRGQQVMIIDCIEAQRNPGADPTVYPGDQIYVPRTIF